MIFSRKTCESVVEANVSEDIRGAVLCLLSELAKGPFNPALSRELLARFHVSSKLGEFLREHLAGKVVLLGNVGNPTPSPVGQLALALASKVNDLDYWRAYRRGSLFENPALTQNPLLGGVQAKSDEVAFKQHFPVGARFRGTICRKALKGTGLLVEVEGRDRPCLLPVDNIPTEFRTRLDSLLGTCGEFEVASVLPSARSVWLKVVRLSPTTMRAETSNDLELERRLTLIQNLHAKGLLTQEEFDEKRRQILAAL